MSSLLLSHEERCRGPWVKLPSETRIFTSLFDELGIEGLSVHEVFMMDENLNDDLKNQHKEKNVKSSEKSPKNVFFANQVLDNACATLAVLNIVMNCQKLTLSDDLQKFKEFCWDFSPTMKGFAITNVPKFREIHNSVARRSFNNYHYIAYVPVDGKIYQLDGLYPDPVKIGEYDDESKWFDAAKGVMCERTMGFYVEGIEFVLLAITRDKFLTNNKERWEDCLYIKKLIESRLDQLNNDWKIIFINENDFEIEEEDDDDWNMALERGNIVKELEEIKINYDDFEKLYQIRSRIMNELVLYAVLCEYEKIQVWDFASDA
ncbi:10920_t:CDS:10 [Entrophospora sp. SA101]|nr:10920_t:CDS:10 [Entrophospora sp. SA101]